MPKFIDITGQKFGRWTAKAYIGKGYYLAVCNCGKEKHVKSYHMQSGNSKSCGCLCSETTIKRLTKHGMTRSPEYESWNDMRRRVFKTNRPNYRWYGAKGITICDEWMEFDAFYRDMGNRPEGTSLDRIDNTKGYCKENCRWATHKQQCRNRSSNLHVTHNGKDYVLPDLCDELGVSYELVRQRVWRGWSIEDAVTIPIKGFSSSMPRNQTPLDIPNTDKRYPQQSDE